MIVKSVNLRCPPERAFALFTGSASMWWPADRRHTGDAASTIHIEAQGRFFERGSDGSEIELGVVRRFEPPHRLTFDWYPGTGPDLPTRVDVRFEAVGDQTCVTVVHDIGTAYAATFTRNAPAYTRSWTSVLDAFAAKVGTLLPFRNI